LTDARLGGLGRESLVSDAGEARLGGLAREALVSGTGLAGRAGGRSGSRATLSVLFAGVVLAASGHARSFTRAGVSLKVNLGAHAAAGSSAKGQRTTTVALAGRAGGRSRGSIMRSNPATATAWGHAKSRMQAALTVGPPPVVRQYAVTVGA
jgi:hypothetical protein